MPAAPPPMTTVSKSLSAIAAFCNQLRHTYSIDLRIGNSTGRALPNQRCIPQRLTGALKGAKDHRLDDKADQDDGQQAGKNCCGVEVIARFENIPADAARP